MESSTVVDFERRPGPLVALDAALRPGVSRTLAAALSHGKSVARHAVGPGGRAGEYGAGAGAERVLPSQVRRADGDDQRASAHRLLHRLRARFRDDERPGNTTGPPERDIGIDPEYEAKVADAKAKAAYTTRVLMQRSWDWDGPSDHIWAELLQRHERKG